MAPIEKENLVIENAVNLSLSGFSLGGNLHRVPRALEELFKLLIAGSLKIESHKIAINRREARPFTVRGA